MAEAMSDEDGLTFTAEDTAEMLREAARLLAGRPHDEERLNELVARRVRLDEYEWLSELIARDMRRGGYESQEAWIEAMAGLDPLG